MDMKCRNMVSIIKIPGAYDICRQNPDSLSGIYITEVMEDQCRIVNKSYSEKYEAKKLSTSKFCNKVCLNHQAREII